MAIGNFLTGSPASSQQFSTITPQQAGVKGAVGNQALRMLQNLGGGQNNFEPIANQARTQFNEQTIPGLAERFTNFGSGANRSSAFQGALGEAGSNLEQGLAALKSQFGQQQQGLDQNLLQLLLGHSLSPESETGFQQEDQGILGGLTPYLSQLLPYLPAILGSFFGPGGTAAGAGVGAGLSALLNSSGQQKPQQQQY